MGPFDYKEDFNKDSDPEQPYNAQWIIAQDAILGPQNPEHEEDIKDSGDANGDPAGGANDFRYTGPRYAGLISYEEFEKNAGELIQGPWAADPSTHDCDTLELNGEGKLTCPSCHSDLDTVINKWSPQEPMQEKKRSLWDQVKERAQKGFSQDDWELDPDEDYRT